MPRFYPRNEQSRLDSLRGPGHVFNLAYADTLTLADRALRYEPDNTVIASVWNAYGGTGKG